MFKKEKKEINDTWERIDNGSHEEDKVHELENTLLMNFIELVTNVKKDGKILICLDKEALRNDGDLILITESYTIKQYLWKYKIEPWLYNGIKYNNGKIWRGFKFVYPVMKWESMDLINFLDDLYEYMLPLKEVHLATDPKNW